MATRKSPTPRTSLKDDYTESLELVLQEQRLDYDAVDKMYEGAKVKNLTFLGAIFATLVFLYDSADQNLPLHERLFIPAEYYGIAVYVLAILALFFALGVLLWALKPRPWQTAYEKEHSNFIKEHNYVQYLEHLTAKYESIILTNAQSYNHKQDLLNISLLPMIAGAIILLLLKTLGG